MTTDCAPDDIMDVVYLTELLNDRAKLEAFPHHFKHIERLVDQEIVNVRHRLFDCKFGGGDLQLPMPVGEPILVREKVYIPDGGRHQNYVGRLLGPRGKTLKSIEQETGCKIMIRGIGSARSGSPSSPMVFNNGELMSPSAQQFNQIYYSSPQHHQNGNVFFQNKPGDEEYDRLHVIIQCEDAPNRAQIRVGKAIQLIQELFKPVDEANDELKRKQLLELSLLKGTFKPSSRRAALFSTPTKNTMSWTAASPSRATSPPFTASPSFVASPPFVASPSWSSSSSTWTDSPNPSSPMCASPPSFMCASPPSFMCASPSPTNFFEGLNF